MSERQASVISRPSPRTRRPAAPQSPARAEPPSVSPELDLTQLLHTVARIVHAEGCEIYLQDPGRKTLTLVAAYGPDVMFVGSQLKVGEGLAGRVFQQLRHMAVEDYVNWEGCAPLFWNCRGCQGCSALAVPVRLDKEPIGVLTIQATTRRRRFSRSDLRLVEACATLVASAISQSFPAWLGGVEGASAGSSVAASDVRDLVGLVADSHGRSVRPLDRTQPDDAFPCSHLTRRESEVAQLVAEGASNSEIATRLGLKLRTVKFHVGNILAKLQLRSRTQLAIWAAEQSWLKRAATDPAEPPFLGKVAWTEPATEAAAEEPTLPNP